MEAIDRSCLIPWVCFGDFNEIMWSTEKRGGNPRHSFYMEMFRDVIARCKLTDLGFMGAKFTWSNGRQGDANIMKRLDRVLATTGWYEKFPNRRVRHLPQYKSDHAPLILECSKDTGNNS